MINRRYFLTSALAAVASPVVAAPAVEALTYRKVETFELFDVSIISKINDELNQTAWRTGRISSTLPNRSQVPKANWSPGSYEQAQSRMFRQGEPQRRVFFVDL